MVLLCEEGELYVRLMRAIDGRRTFLVPRIPVSAEILQLLSNGDSFSVELGALRLSAMDSTIAAQFDEQTIWGGRDRFRLAVDQAVALQLKEQRARL